jgi:hypothetical protein
MRIAVTKPFRTMIILLCSASLKYAQIRLPAMLGLKGWAIGRWNACLATWSG